MLSHHSVGGRVKLRPSSEQRDITKESSAAVFARDLYYASVLERATVCCFRQLHEIRFFPRKIQYPPVERRSSRSPAQSASEYASMEAVGAR